LLFLARNQDLRVDVSTPWPSYTAWDRATYASFSRNNIFLKVREVTIKIKLSLNASSRELVVKWQYFGNWNIASKAFLQGFETYWDGLLTTKAHSGFF
jgi:hypothetical protein